MKREEFEQLIEQEIRWCEKNLAKVNKQYGAGFIRGLKQAMFLHKWEDESQGKQSV